MGLSTFTLIVAAAAVIAWIQTREARRREQRALYWKAISTPLSQQARDALSAYQFYPDAHQPDEVASELLDKGLIAPNAVTPGYHLTEAGRETGYAIGVFSPQAHT